MKRLFVSMAMVAGLLAVAPVAPASPLHAVPAQSASPRQLTVSSLPAGTQISAQLQSRLSTRSTDAGQYFAAIVTAPITDSLGHVIVPYGSQIEGHVRAADRGHGFYGAPQMDLQATRMTINGQVVPIQAALTHSTAYLHRTGVRQRQQLRLERGTALMFQLEQPVAITSPPGGAPWSAVGGGPLY